MTKKNGKNSSLRVLICNTNFKVESLATSRGSVTNPPPILAQCNHPWQPRGLYNEKCVFVGSFLQERLVCLKNVFIAKQYKDEELQERNSCLY